MKNYFIILAVIMTTMGLSAAQKECMFRAEGNISKVTWTAFKTPKKVGVGGAFEKVLITAMPAQDIESFIKGMQFTIHANSINTKNKARDMKIYRYFFSKMISGDYIRGFVTKLTKKTDTTGELEFQLWLNGVSKSEKLAYSYDKKTRMIKAKGKIDVLNYGMNKSLKAITKACYAKHEGVTWPDVKISFETKLAPCFNF